MVQFLRFSKAKRGNWAGLFLSFLFLVSCLTVSAQTTTSSITGYVSDSKGAVEEAIVTVVHMPTNTAYYAITNSKGIYTVSNVIAGGPYTVKIDRIGQATGRGDHLW